MNDQQLLRYSRHIFLPEIDIKGQEKLLNSSVLIIGLGGLGSPVALYLAASGVGKILLADREEIELSNLQRQIIYSEESVGKRKTAAALDHLKKMNSETKLIALENLSADNLIEYVRGVDCVIDASDNFTTRFAVNRACVETKTPLVSGAAIQFTGQLCVFNFKQNKSPCYQCLYPDIDEAGLRCQESGVVAPLVGVIGSLQALEVIKLLLDLPVQSQLLQFNALEMRFKKTQIGSDPKCSVCAEK